VGGHVARMWEVRKAYKNLIVKSEHLASSTLLYLRLDELTWIHFTEINSPSRCLPRRVNTVQQSLRYATLPIVCRVSFIVCVVFVLCFV
jgi:hypothetical protein